MDGCWSGEGQKKFHLFLVKKEDSKTFGVGKGLGSFFLWRAFLEIGGWLALSWFFILFYILVLYSGTSICVSRVFSFAMLDGEKKSIFPTPSSGMGRPK